MTIESARADGEMHRVTIRLDEKLDRWLDELDESGYFADRSEATRTGLRRIHQEPEIFRRRKRKWRRAGGTRFTLRVPEALAVTVNQLEESGDATSAAHVVRVAIAVVSEEYLGVRRSRRSFR